jgi:hypothetical protein
MAGKKAPKAEVEMRIRLVRDLIVSGVESDDQIRQLLETYYLRERNKVLAISRRQVRNYIAICYRNLKQAAMHEDSVAYEMLLNRNLEIYRMARAAGEFSSAIAALREMAKLQDAYKQKIDPETVEMKIVEILVRKEDETKSLLN